MKISNYTVNVKKEENIYVGNIVGVQGAHSQAKSLDELQINLKEVLALCMEEMTEEERARMRNSNCQF